MTSSVIQGVVLGLVQGLTEFLPVSSSGHLVLIPKLLGWADQGAAFDVVLHLATLLAVVWSLREIILELLLKRRWDLMLKIAVAAAPALVFGYLLKESVETYSRSANLIAINLMFWGLILLWSDRRPHASLKQSFFESEITWKQVLTIGFAQPIALLPGTSRSGITITAGLFAGLNRSVAATFSFLASIPVIGAGGAYGLLTLLKEGALEDPSKLVSGFIVALFTGILAIRVLLRYVSNNTYVPFVLYRFALALGVLLFA